MLKFFLGGLLAATLISTPSHAADMRGVQTFRDAKRELTKIYAQNPQATTLYCGCDIRWQGKKMVPDWGRCGFQPRKQPARASRIEWEHMMPAADFGRQLQCWQQGGRKNCADNDPVYAQMEGDMHNLAPAIGEVNGDRPNFQYNDWNGRAGQYGQCEMVIDTQRKMAQPPERSRGVVARAILYMSEAHNIRLSDAQRKLYEAWNNKYPVTDWECHRDDLIAAVQGNHNRFIQEKCH